MNLDPANLILYGKANPVDALDVFGGYVRGVHAKDGLYPTNGRELGTEVKVGAGKVNFPALLRGLKAHGFDGSLTIEREIEGDQQTKDAIAALSRDLTGAFRERFGALRCEEIKIDTERCNAYIAWMAEQTEQVLKEIK